MKAGKVLLILLITLLAITAAGAYWLQDANNLKPEIERLLNENSDYTISIQGDMDWQLFPPLRLRMADVTATDTETSAHVGELQLRMDLSAMWEDVNRWQISELHLLDTTLTQPDTRVEIAALDLMGFSFNTAAPFHVQARIISTAEPEAANDAQDNAEQAPAEPLNVQLDGNIAYFPAGNPNDGVADASTPTRDQLKLTDTTYVVHQGDLRSNGTCQATVQPNETQPADTQPADHTPPAAEEELLPVDALLSADITANCDVTQLTYADTTFSNSNLELHNRNGKLNVALDTPDFFGGKLASDVRIDLTAQPLAWQVLPEIENVDTERLLAWAEQDLDWVALIAANSKITLQGNTPEELAASVQAESDFDGGSGRINVSKIKQQLARLALLSGKADEVANWPDNWDYKEFVGNWQINGSRQTLNFTLDNMQVTADGDYQYLQDSIDMLAHITVHNAEDSPFKINPLLAGTPIPVRCKGPSDDPECKLDERASRTIIARALQRDDESGLRAKLEEKIDEKVPEEYRETARNLLELLGRSLEGEQ